MGLAARFILDPSASSLLRIGEKGMASCGFRLADIEARLGLRTSGCDRSAALLHRRRQAEEDVQEKMRKLADRSEYASEVEPLIAEPRRDRPPTLAAAARVRPARTILTSVLRGRSP